MWVEWGIAIGIMSSKVNSNAKTIDSPGLSTALLPSLNATMR